MIFVSDLLNVFIVSLECFVSFTKFAVLNVSDDHD